MSHADLAHDDALREIDVDPPLYALDTETGGFDAPVNALLSLTLIELGEHLEPKRTCELFILPEEGFEISEGAAKINGYTPELWAERGAIPLREAMTAALEFIGPAGGIGLAHNARFDRGFIEHNERRVGISLGLRPEWICSCDTFRATARQLGLRPANHKLETLARLCGHWGPEFVRGAHGATEDALACAAGYRWLREQLAAKANQGKGASRA